MSFSHLSPRRRTAYAVAALAAACFLAVDVAQTLHRRRGDDPPFLADGPLTADAAERALAELAADLPPAVAASRDVLIGQRDPDGAHCATFRGASPRSVTDWSPERVTADPNGGPATRLGAAWVRRSKAAGTSARREFDWYQTTFRDELTELAGRNKVAWVQLRPLCRSTRRLAEGMRAWQRVPEGLAAPEPPAGKDWPTACLERLAAALAARDGAASSRWSDELAAAVFALDDLHRWLGLLVNTQLASIDFQRKCEPLFDWSERVYGPRYNSWGHGNRLPSYSAASAMTPNLIEVERQAQCLFRRPRGYLEAASASAPPTRAAVWVPPDLREAFGRLRSCLSPANRKAWDQAASMPFERSYLTNMLFRATKAKMLEPLGEVLRRFDRTHADAGVPELMDVMFYRAGTVSSGAEWADRYDPRLMSAGEQVPAGNEQVLRRARRAARLFLGDWAHYGGTPTLREALSFRKLDCVRGTDMIGAVYRNAGRGGYCAVRITCGTAGHTMAAAVVERDGAEGILMADPLASGEGVGRWPEALFRGLTWPAGYPGPRGPAYAAELFVRGLDNYLFAEGYVIRGPNAGLQVRMSLPYLPGRESSGAAKVFAGPYPVEPTVRHIAPADPRMVPGALIR